jgi:hypothetical protein
MRYTRGPLAGFCVILVEPANLPWYQMKSR